MKSEQGRFLWQLKRPRQERRRALPLNGLCSKRGRGQPPPPFLLLLLLLMPRSLAVELSIRPVHLSSTKFDSRQTGDGFLL
ncbi:unnamed protein product [Victoria cruziana]